MKLRVTMADGADALPLVSPSTHVVVFPELVDGGYAHLRHGGGIHTLDDRYVMKFRQLSRRLHCTCIAGSMAICNQPGKMTNTALVFRNGARIHRYDKIHLFRPASEGQYFRSGSEIAAFTIHAGRKKLRAGLVICYDLRFPELARMLAAKGIEILFVPARWPMVRDDAWQTLLKARAIENQIFVVGCNASGKEGGVSYVFDPVGHCVMTSRDDQGAPLREVSLDLDRIAEAHAMHRNLRDAVLLRRIRFPAR